jgi:uncharacterized protein (DUF2267 family)
VSQGLHGTRHTGHTALVQTDASQAQRLQAAHVLQATAEALQASRAQRVAAELQVNELRWLLLLLLLLLWLFMSAWACCGGCTCAAAATAAASAAAAQGLRQLLHAAWPNAAALQAEVGQATAVVDAGCQHAGTSVTQSHVVQRELGQQQA